MNKKRWFLVILGVLILSSIWTYRYVSGKAYLMPVQIVGTTDGRIPYVKVEIEGKEYFFILDLGLSDYAGIDPPCLLEIQNRVFKGTVTSMGVLGKKYQKKFYEIPELKISQKTFSPVLLHERSIALQADALITPSDDCITEITAGTLGSLLFKETCLCLDLYSSMMAFCDSFDTFKKELKPHNPFTKIPFLLKNGLIEFDVEVAETTLHCILDTGSTLNHINTPNPDNILIAEFTKTKEQFESVQIGGKDFGPIVFSQLPIKLPLKIDAVIGLEFMREHVVFIDFIRQEIYFCKATYPTGSKEASHL